MPRIEEELQSALNEHAINISGPSRDLFAAALARHHRRRVRQATALTTGTLGLVAALMLGLAQHDQTSPAIAAVAPPTVVLDARTVSDDVAAAMDSDEQVITYTEYHTTYGGQTTRLEAWRDDVTNDYRILGTRADKKFAGAGYQDIAVSYDDDHHRIATVVDHAEKSWHEETSYAPPPRALTAAQCNGSGWGGYAPQGQRCALNGDAIRKANQGANPAFVVVGRETVDGRGTIHLQRTVADPGTKPMDLWVDDADYQPVRSVLTFEATDTREAGTAQEDFQFLPRTASNLELLKTRAPSGYIHSHDIDSDENDAASG